MYMENIQKEESLDVSVDTQVLVNIPVEVDTKNDVVDTQESLNIPVEVDTKNDVVDTQESLDVSLEADTKNDVVDTQELDDKISQEHILESTEMDTNVVQNPELNSQQKVSDDDINVLSGPNDVDVAIRPDVHSNDVKIQLCGLSLSFICNCFSREKK